MRDAEDIDELQRIYNEMNEYEKSFLATDVVKSLNQYIEKLKEIRAAAEESGGDKPEEDGSDGGDETEGAGEV